MIMYKPFNFGIIRDMTPVNAVTTNYDQQTFGHLCFHRQCVKVIPTKAKHDLEIDLPLLREVFALFRTAFRDLVLYTRTSVHLNKGDIRLL